MTEKIDAYQIVTDRIISALETGTIPWRKPWNSSMPMNVASKKAYRGINTMLLGLAGYSSPYWGTYKQWIALGGQVRKGEKSTPIVFWKFLQVEDKKTKKDKKVPLLRYYNVFNCDQIDFMEGFSAPSNGDKLEFSPIEACEAIIAGYTNKPNVETGDKACYIPLLDSIKMPSKESFHSIPEWYSTLFHEFTHSTGHTSRLNRDGIMQFDEFGSDRYSKEELIAELGSAFICFETGIGEYTLTNSEAYIAGWLKVLKGDKKLVTMASASAQKAVDHMKGIKPFKDHTSECTAGEANEAGEFVCSCK